MSQIAPSDTEEVNVLPIAISAGLVAVVVVMLIGLGVYFFFSPTIRHQTHLIRYLQQHKFSPNELTIKRGDSVKFVNDTKDLILVVGADEDSLRRFGDFGSGELFSGVGARWVYRFERTGTVHFYNETFPNARGTIVVEK